MLTLGKTLSILLSGCYCATFLEVGKGVDVDDNTKSENDFQC
jgi:hypothetical protein